MEERNKQLLFQNFLLKIFHLEIFKSQYHMIVIPLRKKAKNLKALGVPKPYPSESNETK